MDLHEYQAKNLLKKYYCPVPLGEVIWHADEAIEAADKLGIKRFVVKAQVHAGGRGKAGGVKIVEGKEALLEAVKSLLGTQLVTYQTDAKGQPVNQLLIETPSNIAQELYLGMVVDRASQRIAVMASTEGGVEIEEVAAKDPDKIFKITIDPAIGLQPYQCRKIFAGLALDKALARSFNKLLLNLYKMFMASDLSMLEINPLVVTADNELLCLDAKINIDDNAMFRQSGLRELRDPSQENERENKAHQWELNYIALDGKIGCMVNGAGLAMATMDLIKLHGGDPANFLDVGGGATKERVTEAFKIILSDTQVKGVLVNIFGGIVRCDLIADGILEAVAEVGVEVPVVVRLAGNRAEEGAAKLAASKLNVTAATGFDDAAKKIVELVGA